MTREPIKNYVETAHSLEVLLRAKMGLHTNPRMNMQPADIERCDRMRTVEQLRERKTWARAVLTHSQAVRAESALATRMTETDYPSEDEGHQEP